MLAGRDPCAQLYLGLYSHVRGEFVDGIQSGQPSGQVARLEGLYGWEAGWESEWQWAADLIFWLKAQNFAFPSAPLH